MGSTLIQLVQEVTTELGLPTPTSAIRAPDNTGRQLAALANRCGRLLLRQHDWTYLTNEWHLTVPAPIATTGSLTQGSGVITGVADTVINQLLPNQMIVTGYGIMTAVRLIAVNATANTVTIDQPATQTSVAQPIYFRQDLLPNPPDYQRSINRTQWDRSMRWELRGPQSPQADQWVRSGIVATGPRRMYRQIDGGYRIWPAPAASDAGSQMITEYITSWWAFSASGVGQPAFLADQDTCAFDDDCMTAGMKWLFFGVKGFDTSDLEKQFRVTVQNAIATDGPSPTLDMDRNRFPIFISPSNIQDADFPGSFGNR